MGEGGREGGRERGKVGGRKGREGRGKGGRSYFNFHGLEGRIYNYVHSGLHILSPISKMINSLKFGSFQFPSLSCVQRFM